MDKTTPSETSHPSLIVNRPIMLSGKTLVIGPSRAGKSFYSAAFKASGLHVIDADKDTDLMGWHNDSTDERVKKPPGADDEWLATNHFTIKPIELEQFLATQGDVIVFAHCWNIMSIVDQFDRVAYMSLSPEELERRLVIDRPDHTSVGSEAELEFFRKRHQNRSEQARERGISFIDATLTPDAFYVQLSRVSPTRLPDPTIEQ